MPYKIKNPYFHILPSQFPNDRFSPTKRAFLAHTATGIVPDSHRVPFSPAVPVRYRRHFVCDILLLNLIVTQFWLFVKVKTKSFCENFCFIRAVCA